MTNSDIVGQPKPLGIEEVVAKAIDDALPESDSLSLAPSQIRQAARAAIDAYEQARAALGDAKMTTEIAFSACTLNTDWAKHANFIIYTGDKEVLRITSEGELVFADASEAAEALLREWKRLRGADTTLSGSPEG